MKRNKALLLKTADRIEEIPESYNQARFCIRSQSSPCGVEACLAGEIIIASRVDVQSGIRRLSNARDPRNLAAKLVGIPRLEDSGIFGATANHWPAYYRRKYNNATSKGDQAKAAAGLLRYLAKGGKV